MTALTTVAGTRSRISKLTAVRRHRAEILYMGLIAGTWLYLVIGAVSALSPNHTATSNAHHYMAGMGGGNRAGRDALDAALAATVMALAMMGPVGLAAVRHVSTNSLIWRRGRAVAIFAACYLGGWAAFSLVVMSAEALVVALPGWTTLAGGLTVAGGWQLSGLKQRALRDCHKTVPLPPFGSPANLADGRFGARHASACVRSCWALMLACDFAPVAHLLAMATVSGFVIVERRVQRPRKYSRAAGYLLLVSAAVVIGLGVLGVLRALVVK